MELLSTTVQVIAVIVFIVFVYMFGYVRGFRQSKEELVNKLNSFEDQLTKMAEEDVIPVKIERENNILYVYKESDGLFLAQGKSLEEIRDLLTKRFPGKRIIASQENVKDAGLIS